MHGFIIEWSNYSITVSTIPKLVKTYYQIWITVIWQLKNKYYTAQKHGITNNKYDGCIIVCGESFQNIILYDMSKSTFTALNTARRKDGAVQGSLGWFSYHKLQ